MRLFKDGEKREWTVEITVQSMRDVKSLLGRNLFALVEDGLKGLGELLADPIGLVDVLYVLCRQQCKDRGLTDEDFGRLMAGDVLNAAAEAFVEAYWDFFPKPEIRDNLRKLSGKAKKAGQAAMRRLETAVEQIDPEAIVSRLFERTKSSERASSSPESSASAPAPGASAT